MTHPLPPITVHGSIGPTRNVRRWPLRLATVLSALLAAAPLPLSPVRGAEPGQAASRIAGPAPQEVVLWPNGAPGAKGKGERHTPRLTVYRPTENTHNGSAMLICPGGGYGHLAVDHEGRQIAEWCQAMGTTAFVLRYRIAPDYHHPAPLQDATRAIRLMRHRADAWQIDPHRVAVIGFSAGGHLASSLATHYDAGDAAASDPIERQSSRPDLVVLCYPVITMKDPFTHKGSRRNLLGEHPSAELIERFSNQTQVTPQTPPTFLFHTGTDRAVPVENSLMFYTALRKAGVAAELHIYERGPHGVGLAQNRPELADWPDRCKNWLGIHGFFAAQRKPPGN